MRIGKLRLLSWNLLGCLLAFAGISISAGAQSGGTNEWTWMGGSNMASNGPPSAPGVYGTLGTPAAANIPGTRWGASEWTDSSGDFWLFGGHGVDGGGIYGYLNDLWKFNPSTEEWTWMSGGNTVVSPPETVQDCEGYDCGQPGVYGTLGTPAPANVPGGRTTAASWRDNGGNLWLFGGYGFGAAFTGPDGELNDLWMYNPTTNEWTWMGGNTSDGNNSARAIPGVYGTLGTPAVGNLPGGRENASSTTDSQGNFWLFGGNGYDSVGVCAILNDIWEFNPSSDEWTWIGGENTGPVDCNGWPGVYGTLGTPAAGNAPGGREGSVIWTDGSGNLWLFGGRGFTVNSSGYLNDLWEFAPSSKEWVWMGGSNMANALGVYGTLGMPSASNVPSGRWVATSWTDSSGNLWLLGGQGIDASNYLGYLNDFWELNTSTNPVQWTWMGGSSTIPASCAGKDYIVGDTDYGLINCGQPGVYGTLGIPDASNIPGGRDTASGWTDKSGDFWLFGGFGFDSSGNGSHLNDRWVFQSTVGTLPASMPAFSVAAGTYRAVQTVTISDAAPNATIYYTTNGTTPTPSSSVYSGQITVGSSETLDAIATASGYATSAVASAAYTINLLPPSFAVAGTAVTVTPGADTANTSTITLTPSGGFTGAISLSCAISPTAASDPATCSIPASVTITGASAQTTTLTVSTTAATTARNQIRTLLWPSVGGTAFALVCLFGIPARRRRWQTKLGMLVLLFSLTCGVSACGGGGGSGSSGGGGGGGRNPGTTAGSYNLTVTGASGAITSTATITLIVQ